MFIFPKEKKKGLTSTPLRLLGTSCLDILPEDFFFFFFFSPDENAYFKICHFEGFFFHKREHHKIKE